MEMLRMTGISKAFFGVTVLDNVDFAVEQGEVHALLGENGAGKSTLMNILAGVYTRDKGSVVFEGKDMGHITVQASEQAGIALCIRNSTSLTICASMKTYSCARSASPACARWTKSA